ncbi:hypothetical protein [Paenibacillus agricola]|uniref:Uncharacterized protein n=1 Tax=Paenibacillus agricola TaxID=2716264 RepID=A0ABX0J1V6_9BACL|nr:hypothetical protein [Paenibacillus agricola]NHN29416.1 hypothetical protein [Paenibacillus agricola]
MPILLYLLLPGLSVAMILVVFYCWSMRDYHTYDSLGLKRKDARQLAASHKPYIV